MITAVGALVLFIPREYYGPVRVHAAGAAVLGRTYERIGAKARRRYFYLLS